jgi:type VI secretion system protein ImpL
MLKYLIALLVVALGWTAVLILDGPIWIGIVVSFLAILTLVAILVWRRLEARRAASEIERSLSRQAASLSQNARPDQRADIEAMQAEFTKAIRALRSSRLARKGGDALTVLPWYVLIGPPGAGKSTALRNSGLQFPYLSARGGGVRGVGGTRNCDWWLTNEAVILDTAGRYAMESDDQEEWFAFLEMLRRNRPRRPINGVLVAINVAELGGTTDEEIADLAKRIRDRVDEVMTQLHVVVPVYLLCTKADLVPGFVETFSELKKADRGQIWGFTFPFQDLGAEPGEAFAAKFDELVGVVEARSLVRMAAERRPDARPIIYEFPQQLNALRSGLLTFVSLAFAPNVYQETPVLRGVYFTSGTQEGRPIDRVMQKMAEAFGVRAEVAHNSAPGEARSYFLRDVFARVVFPDKTAATVGSLSRRELAIRAATIGGVLLGALLLSLFPLGAYIKNRRLIAATRAVSDALAAAAPARPGGPLADEAFENAGPSIDLVVETATEGPSPTARLGMYQGDEILPPLGKIVRESLVRPFIDDFERGADRSYDALKLYLILTEPKAGQGEPDPDAGSSSSEWKAARVWAVASLRDRWARRSLAGLSGPSKRAIDKLVRMFLWQAEQDDDLFPRRDKGIVDSTRKGLRASTNQGTGIDKLVGELDCHKFDIPLAQVVGAASIWFKEDVAMSGAFTRACWEDQVRARFSEAKKEGETWVIANSEPTASNAELAHLRSAYFQRYIAEWEKFLRQVRVNVQPNLDKGVALLTALTDKPRPLFLVLKTLDDNTRLAEAAPTGVAAVVTEEASSRLKKVVDSFRSTPAAKLAMRAAEATVKPHSAGGDLYTAEDVSGSFFPLLKLGGLGGPAPAPGAAPAPAAADTAKPLLDTYHGELERLLQAAELYRQDKEYDKLKALVRTTWTSVNDWVGHNREDGWDLILDAWLLPPIRSLDVAAEGDRGGGTNAAWCEAVVGPFDELRKKFPFADSGREADMAAVMQFFAPGKGALWAHYDAFLKKDINRIGMHYKLREGGSSASYHKDIGAFLDRAQEVTDVLFPGGGAQAGVPLEVRLRPSPNVTKIVFEVDGQTLAYRNEPERWISIKWPGDKHTGASIRAYGQRGEELIPSEGEWGFPHLLAMARIAVDGDVLSAIWKLKTTDTDLRIDVRPARFLEIFRGFTVPREIANGPSPCAGGR